MERTITSKIIFKRATIRKGTQGKKQQNWQWTLLIILFFLNFQRFKYFTYTR